MGRTVAPHAWPVRHVLGGGPGAGPGRPGRVRAPQLLAGAWALQARAGAPLVVHPPAAASPAGQAPVPRVSGAALARAPGGTPPRPLAGDAARRRVPAGSGRGAAASPAPRATARGSGAAAHRTAGGGAAVPRSPVDRLPECRSPECRSPGRRSCRPLRPGQRPRGCRCRGRRMEPSPARGHRVGRGSRRSTVAAGHRARKSRPAAGSPAARAH